MRSFTVTWDKEAHSDVARIWLGAGDRDAVMRAVHEAIARLVSDPYTPSVEVHEGLRQWRRHPLQIVFEVRDLDRVVEIVRVFPL